MNLEKAIYTLETRRIKPSIQRLAIMNYLIEHSDTHPTAEDVYQGLHEELPTLSRTTVYTTLHLLSERKAATLLTIEERCSCFDAITRPHAHFYCKKCGKVTNIETNSETFAQYSRNFLPEDYKADEVQVCYKGLCAECNFSLID